MRYLMCALVLLTSLATAAPAYAASMRLDMGLLELVRQLTAHRPVSHQTLVDFGITDLHKDGGHYTGADISLNDENAISKIELREYDGGTFLILRLGKSTVTREEIESEFGPFRFFSGPKGKSAEELILYGNDAIENFTLKYGLDQTTLEPVYFSIDSVTPK